MNEQRVTHVLGYYDLGGFRTCERIRHGYVNDNWRVETTTGRYFLKHRRRVLMQPQTIIAQHALMKYLRDAGFPAPAVIPTRNGEAFLALHNEIYEMQHYIPGDPCNATDPVHLNAAARTLARYHNTVEPFDQLAFHWPHERYGPGALNRIIERTLDAWGDQADAQLCLHIEQLKAHARELTTRFREFKGLPELVIHGDYYAENLIFQDDTVVGVVDYDLAHWCTRSMELAEALIYFATERTMTLKHIVYGGVLDLDVVRQFLEAYTETARLSESEIRALPYLIGTIWLCAALDPPLEPPLNLTAAPQALPEILLLANWVLSRAENLIEIGLAAKA